MPGALADHGDLSGGADRPAGQGGADPTGVAGPAGEDHGGVGSVVGQAGRRIRVFLVDDHPLVLAGVNAELADQVDVVGQASEVDAAIEMIGERQPDVVLLDVHMPGGGGRAVIEGVATDHPHIRFLALSVSDAASDVIEVIRAGARGYVTKTISGPELIDAVTRVAAGDAVFSPRLAGFVLDAFSNSQPPPPGASTSDQVGQGGYAGALGASGPSGIDPELDILTAREREVLRLIARGYAYKEVATRLGISAKTVESHVSAVLRKLQLSNRHQLTRWATDRRIL
ncbi:MAG: response regulator [Acidimicrobiales bacterium]